MCSSDLLREVLAPRAARLEAGLDAVALTVPERHRGWIEERAHVLRERMLAAGYPVLGDADLLLPEPATPARAVPPSADAAPVADLAVGWLLADDAGRIGS